ncbi:uncharacterized protein [Rutidosis leptorrhynchoides]|uniref:uncharacterized protein n=1 Tax=Rutidosis leptorrhynchoides TaxID=125765 RepID=UPI003A98D848
MAKSPSTNSFSIFLFYFLFLVIFLCISARSSDIPHTVDSHYFETREVNYKEQQQLFPSIHRALIEYFRHKLTQFDSIDPPTTALPTAPITNPVTAPVTNSPGIVTVPGTNPGGTPPVTNPVNPPVPVTNPQNPPIPVTNPVNSPVPVTNPVTTPTTNPVTTPSTNPGTQPTMNPVTAPSGGNGNGQAGRWCVAKNGASQMALQSALDYACGTGGADCVTIQQGQSCYEPATLQNHASFAFNSYYQKNPSPTSCDFGGVAAVTTTNPSTGSCVYPSSASSSSSPTITSPTTTPSTTPNTQTPTNPAAFPAPATSASPGSTFPGTQSPPPGFSLGSPDPTNFGALGASPPLVNTASVSNNLRPIIGFLVIVTSIFMLNEKV